MKIFQFDLILVNLLLICNNFGGKKTSNDSNKKYELYKSKHYKVQPLLVLQWSVMLTK